MSYVFPKSTMPVSLKAAIVCVLISVVGFVMSQLFNDYRLSRLDEVPVISRMLQFKDQKDGAVLVIDVKNNEVLDVIEGEAGFVRGVLRAINRERRMRGISQEEPMQLAAYQDGRLILEDPKTKVLIELESFGKTNAESFSTLLMKKTTVKGS